MTYTEFPVASSDLDPEDAKIVRLARTALLRAYPGAGAAEGAAVRDADGRTYAAATVAHSDAALSTSALQGALSAAYSSGARRFEALVVLGRRADLDPRDLALAEELAAGAPVLLADTSGSVVAVTTTQTGR
jgi:cytidine deaminase